MQTKRLVRIVALFVAVWVIILAEVSLGGIQKVAFANNQSKEEIKAPIEVEIQLKCMYLDGEISEETVTETIYSMENFWAKYEEWKFTGIENKKLVFHKEMDDISPLLKANGYFGITNDGILSIFNGKPYKSHIIQSFFQIDVGKLESHKRNELKKGIPIKTKDRYVEVLEIFKTYTKEKQAN
ncbi:BofC C-terminal domain-containing protein [Bacillus sp. V3B]|uniref:BofC C-terminal domain-containing protein n=1 Tax=Bacillus sp. V3B TaxID=2804915 RepID=UPI00210D25F0|nr:BofC C-terminal domain-containing protein [Bacillus sp. V3B]MCQ6273548.1 BofC C-terminal domain-containing protein [Bacillus sp. V3B]